MAEIYMPQEMMPESDTAIAWTEGNCVLERCPHFLEPAHQN